MTDLLRQEIAATADLIVVKVGTRVLTAPDGTLNRERIAQFAEEMSRLLDSGRKMVMVSSGAVGAGMDRLKLKQRPTDLAQLQAVAAVGQARLIEAYDQTLAVHGRHGAQVLLTAEDLDHRVRYLNIRNTLLSLLEFGVLPIINENDTVAVDELMTTFGDNDRLAARVTNLIRAPLLVILSDVAGLYDRSPDDPDAKVIPVVQKFDDQLMSFVRDKKTGLSKGGMASKLEAARLVTTAGENVIIASGRDPQALTKIVAGESVGTLFLPQGKTVPPRKRWIGFSVEPRGRIIVDDGAKKAVEQAGRSLLAIGVVGVEGDFEKGDVVRVCGANGVEIARGLTNYTAAEVARIRGAQSEKISDILGHCPYVEVIHRDNLTLSRAAT
ncbi:glutamate 5-kinase [Blastopirellula marina]|uniref:Glutamate 5-kinase n=1 Tax=Blastopirellula marina TaxID=124 RepID=A0A2S8F2F4_9BACT|nr:glutamate 5-kinase [Blastopirellula marina]PQO26323.1 glutamate 5-kinase [Blastopirellula marina]PQO47203.1 glutamate 5-kinase [Blastopirellula marina]PTL40723.1 glutamate 5-kinase [Blastopirellula marina]